jgi:hypothetical protein
VIALLSLLMNAAQTSAQDQQRCFAAQMPTNDDMKGVSNANG